MTIWSVIAFCFSPLLLFPLFFFFFELLFDSVAEFSIIPIDASTLPAELQRLLNTVRELDERSQCNCFQESLFYILFVGEYPSALFYLSFNIYIFYLESRNIINFLSFNNNNLWCYGSYGNKKKIFLSIY